MKTLIAGVLGAAVLATGSAAALAATPAAQNAAVEAYRQAIGQDCQSGVWVGSRLHRLDQTVRTTGYRGYLPSPQAAEQECQQSP